MFTGIIQNQGILIRAQKKAGILRAQFRFQKPERKIQMGESIAVNGVCLTVVQFKSPFFEVEIVPETQRDTTLGGLIYGEKVNLERSLRYGDRIGGHFIMGHVDGFGRIKSLKKQGAHVILEIIPPSGLLRLLAPKGSVAIDGISLTIQKKKAESFEVAVIPHTLEETNLKNKKTGERVNLEIDVIDRYLKMSAQGRQQGGKDRVFKKRLKSEGF